MYRLVCSLLIALSSVPALASDKYPLAMSVTYTEGELKSSSLKEANYHLGDDYCTRGTRNSAPVCHTVDEWAELDSLAGTPETAVFTLADGTVVKTQSNSVNKLPGYLVCFPGSQIVFCTLFYDLLSISHPPSYRTEVVSGFNQIVTLTQEEVDAYRKKLFRDGTSFTLTIPYKLKRNVDKQGFQNVEVETDTLPPDQNNPFRNRPVEGSYHVEPVAH